MASLAEIAAAAMYVADTGPNSDKPWAALDPSTPIRAYYYALASIAVEALEAEFLLRQEPQ